MAMNSKRLEGEGKAPDRPAVFTDLVCGMKVDPAGAAGTGAHNGRQYFFCSQHCVAAFSANPEKYLRAETGVAQPARPANDHHHHDHGDHHEHTHDEHAHAHEHVHPHEHT